MAVTVVKRFPVPTRNGIKLQFSSIELSIGAASFPWVTEISYEQNLDPGELRGTSPYPMGVTVGELKANASLTIDRSMRELFLRTIENGTPGFMTKFFTITVAYQEYGWDQVEQDTFDARMTGTGHDYSQGNNVLLTKIPLYVPYIKLNGHIPIAGIPV